MSRQWVADDSKEEVHCRPRSGLALLGAGFVALIAIALGSGYLLYANRSALIASYATGPLAAARLSIVVPPFTNLSNDPGQDYFADGITENLATDLSLDLGPPDGYLP